MKNILAYFDCGHAALQLAAGTLTVYKLPPKLTQEGIARYLPNHLKANTQITASPADFCGSCNPNGTIKHLVNVIQTALEENGLPASSKEEILQHARAKLAELGLLPADIDKVMKGLNQSSFPS